jgi:hypothetical protein
VSVVLSGRGLCDGLITRPEESYRLWCVSECDREASIMRGPWPTGGSCAMAGGYLAASSMIRIRSCGLGPCVLEQGTDVGFFKHDNEQPGSIRGRKYLTTWDNIAFSKVTVVNGSSHS